jgi:hypothetical protein
MSPQFEELVVEHALAALEKQVRFDGWLGRHGWNWDRESGLLTLRRLEAGASGAVTICATQALGSVSRMSDTWTWIWANDLAEISDELMNSARRLRTIGEEQVVPEFTNGEFPSVEVDAHLLSLVAMGLSEADAYFRGSYLGGEGFVLINAGELGGVIPASPARTNEVIKILQEVDAVCADHRRAIMAYLRRIDWDIEENAGIVVAQNGNERLQLTFDPAGRLLSICDGDRIVDANKVT